MVLDAVGRIKLLCFDDPVLAAPSDARETLEALFALLGVLEGIGLVLVILLVEEFW